MRNARLDGSQAGIKTDMRNISSLRHVDDTTLMAEREELKSLLMRVKGKSEKVGLTLNIQKAKIMVFMANRRGNNESSDRLYLLGLQNH